MSLSRTALSTGVLVAIGAAIAAVARAVLEKKENDVAAQQHNKVEEEGVVLSRIQSFFLEENAKGND
jgi:hypothetical protein